MKYGFKKVIALSMLVDSTLTALSPIAANLHYSALIAFRFVIGMAHGVEMASITSGRRRLLNRLEPTSNLWLTASYLTLFFPSHTRLDSAKRALHHFGSHQHRHTDWNNKTLWHKP